MRPLASLTLTLLLSMTGLQTGCGTVNTTSTRQIPPADAVTTKSQINDLFTRIFLKATNVRLFPAPSGNMKAQIDVANDGFDTQSFAYQFQWLDAAGNPVPFGTTPWQRTSVPAGGTTTIGAVAPTLDAIDFNLQLRRER